MPRLTFQPGLFTDGPDLSLPNTWVSGNNIRFRDGRPETIDLWRPISDEFLGKARNILVADVVRNSGGGSAREVIIVIGTQYSLYRAKRSASAWNFEEITEVSDLIEAGDYGPKEYSEYSNKTRLQPATVWSLNRAIGGVFCSHPSGVYALLQGNDEQTGDDAVPHHASFVTEDNFAIYIGASSKGNSNANAGIAESWTNKTVVWSDQDAYVDYTISDLTLAGFYHLKDGNHAVGGGATTRGNIIWSDTAIYKMDPLYDAEFVFGFNKIDTGCGLAGPRAWAQANGAVFWMSPQLGFHIYDGGTVQELNCTIRSETTDVILFDQLWLITAYTDTASNEVVWNIPRGRNGSEIDGEIRYNYVEQTWSLGDKARLAQCDRSPLETGFSVKAIQKGTGTSVGGSDASTSVVYEEGLKPHDDDVESFDWELTSAPMEVAQLTSDADAYGRAIRMDQLVIDRRTVLPPSGDGDFLVEVIARTDPEPGDSHPIIQRETVHPGTRRIGFHIEGQQLQLRLSGSGRAKHRFGDFFARFLPVGGDR